MRREYNSLKRHALAVFEHRGWLSPAAWAALAKVYPVRSAYSYLKHYIAGSCSTVPRITAAYCYIA
jgi:hypothetical protein